MAKFFNFNDGTRVCVDAMQVRYIRPVVDTDMQCRSMYSHEELEDITENKPAGISRIVVNRGVERVYEEHPVIAYEVTVIFQGTTGDKIYLRVDEYERFLETVIEADSKDTDEHMSNDCPLTQAVFDGAPDDVEYAAMDCNGGVYWYKRKPTISDGSVVWDAANKDFMEPDTLSWTRSCIRRKR